jgi:hypothetical protein
MVDLNAAELPIRKVERLALSEQRITDTLDSLKRDLAAERARKRLAILDALHEHRDINEIARAAHMDPRDVSWIVRSSGQTRVQLAIHRSLTLIACLGIGVGALSVFAVIGLGLARTST